MLHKRFICEVIFENEHTPVRVCTMFASAHLLRSLRWQTPSNQNDPDSRVTGEAGSVLQGCTTGVISFCFTVVRCWAEPVQFNWGASYVLFALYHKR
jgi:hypothetical protein